MQRTHIPGLDMSISKFIFGTASLFNVGLRAQRLNLLAMAIDHGFTHFDTAPYYGFGMAERDLAPILRAHPEVTVTTKVGIYSPGGEQRSYPEIFLRKALGRVLKPISAPTISFDLKRAQASLEGSLRRLGRDHIDIYTLHEPELELIDVDAWVDWLSTKQKQGLIRHYGLAAAACKLEPLLQNAPRLAGLIQTMDSLVGREADFLEKFQRPMQITYGYVTAARANGANASVKDILQSAVKRNRTGCIVVSTTRPNRLAQYSQWLEEMAAVELG